MATDYREQAPSWAYRLVLVVMLALALFLRQWRIDEFITIDENRWHERSADFAAALAAHDYAETFRSEHPGVTSMWVGAASQSIVQGLRSAAAFSPWLERALAPLTLERDLPPYPETLLTRRLMALGAWLGVVGLYLLGRRFPSAGANLFATMFIAFDPLYIASSRIHNLDGLLACFVTLALWALLCYGERRRRSYLLLSAACAALAALTKVSGVLITTGAVVATGWYAWQGRHGERRWARRWLGDVVIWAAAAVAVGFALWPALWVAPLSTFREMVSGAFEQVSNPHRSGSFFMGSVRADPGPLFYPVAWAVRTTPLVMLGLLFLPLGLRRDRRATPAVIALLCALAFGILLSLSLKKGDRYLLPAFLWLCLPAGYGLNALTARIAAYWRKPWVLPTTAAGSLLIYVSLLWPTVPYYSAYYNPLTGGAAAAPRIMLVGVGEGLEQAAAYLNAKPRAEQLQVASMRIREFEPFFVGQTLEVEDRPLAYPDYFVTYSSGVQRGFDADLLAALEGSQPEFVARAGNGLAYAWVYANPVLGVEQQAVFEAVAAEPGGGLLLMTSSTAAARRDTLGVELLKVQRRDQLLTELQWRYPQVGAVWLMALAGIDEPAVDALSVTLGQVAKLDQVETRGTVRAARYTLDEPVLSLPQGDLARRCAVGDFAEFRGLEASDMALHAGEPLEVSLYWLAQSPADRDYHVFVHLVREEILAQSDGGPQGNLRPTSSWRQGEMILDARTILIPEQAPAGEYELFVGMYDPETMQRVALVDEAGVQVPDGRLAVATLAILP